MATKKKATNAKGTAKASSGKAAATREKTLHVKTSPRAKFPTIVLELGKAFKHAGCPGCRSGFDRIVFQDQQVLTDVR